MQSAKLVWVAKTPHDKDDIVIKLEEPDTGGEFFEHPEHDYPSQYVQYRRYVLIKLDE